MKYKRFVIPQEKASVIAYIDNNKVYERGKIDIPYHSKSVITENNLIVSLCFGSKPHSRRLRVFDMNGRQLLRKEYKYRSIAYKGNVVYLGGQYEPQGGELFRLIDLSNIDFTPEEIDLPIQSVKGKSIDDILIHHDALFLVDNIIFPKYIFEYNIATPNKPLLGSTRRLPNNGTYERIYKGDINQDWMILFSATVGGGGAIIDMRGNVAQHITVFGGKNMVLTFGRDTIIIRDYAFDKFSNNYEKFLELDCIGYELKDVALVGNYLVLLFENVIKCIDLSGEICKDNFIELSQNLKNMSRLLKMPDEGCLILSGGEYEVLQLPV